MPKAIGAPGASSSVDDESIKSDLDSHKVRSRTGVRVGMKDLIEKKKKMKLIAHHLKEEEKGEDDGEEDDDDEKQGDVKQKSAASAGTTRFPSKRKPLRKGEMVDKNDIGKHPGRLPNKGKRGR